MLVILHNIDECVIHRRVVCMMLVTKSMHVRRRGFQTTDLYHFNWARDSATFIGDFNERWYFCSVAIHTISILYFQIIDIRCFSHTLGLVGGRFKTPILDDFIKTWISLFSRSPKKLVNPNFFTGLKSPFYPATRWWPKWEVNRDVLFCLENVKTFIN